MPKYKLPECWVIIEGDVVSGIKFHGPFVLRKEAEQAAAKLKEYNRIVDMEHPDEAR